MGFQEIARFPEKVMKLLRKRCLAVVKVNRITKGNHIFLHPNMRFNVERYKSEREDKVLKETMIRKSGIP